MRAPNSELTQRSQHVLQFIAPSELQDERLPGGKGELVPLKDGQVLLIAHLPASASEDEVAWVSRALTTLVNEGIADMAVYLPEGWSLQAAHVGKT